MQGVSLKSFQDELTKNASLRDLWQKFMDVFRSKDTRAQRQADYFFSQGAGRDKWSRLSKNVGSPDFVKAVVQNPGADDKLKEHVRSLHEMTVGSPVGKVRSDSTSGKTYEIRKMPGGRLGCQCPDWRYKGSVNNAYECRHIKKFKTRLT